MKQFNHVWFFLAAITILFSSCEALGDVFQAGMITSVVIIVIVIALILWLVSRFRK